MLRLKTVVNAVDAYVLLLLATGLIFFGVKKKKEGDFPKIIPLNFY